MNSSFVKFRKNAWAGRLIVKALSPQYAMGCGYPCRVPVPNQGRI